MRVGKSLFLSVLLCSCGGPLPLLSGGKLDGPVKPTPASFAFVNGGTTIQLETRPEDPYSVNVTSAIVGDGLYVSAGNSRSRWVQNIEVTPLVRVRIAGDVYELAARRVADATEMDAFAEAWITRNSWARDPRKLDGEVWVFRLEPR
jgi:F420H(2)-dependent quinone reductase